MILPSKYISADQTLLGVGGRLLKKLSRPVTITGLWEQVREDPIVGNYERFILALDLLHIIGALTYEDGLLRKKSNDS